MSVGGIILFVAVSAICLFEVVSLIITIIKRKKEKKAPQTSAEDNNNKEGSVQ